MDEAMKADIRRQCGYLDLASASGFQGWRFHQAHGLLEYRMSRLSGAEEAVARQYLATLATLNQTAEDVFVSDQRERALLLADWRRRLCGFLGVPPGPSLASGSPSP